MAGKYHRDFRHYAVYQDGNVFAPGHKGIKAYAEGYQAFRNGEAKANPHVASSDDESDFQSWEYGWQDGERGSSATHVGPPDAPFVDPEPPADPDDDLPWDHFTTHAALDEFAGHWVEDHGLALPEGWGSMTLAAKKAWLAEAL